MDAFAAQFSPCAVIRVIESVVKSMVLQKVLPKLAEVDPFHHHQAGCLHNLLIMTS